MELITRVLAQSIDKLGRDGHKIAEVFERSARLNAAFELPEIRATGVLTETDKVASAMTLPIEFSVAFGKEIGVVVITYGADACAFSYLVEISDAVACHTVEITFSDHEINVGQTEDWEVGGIEDIKCHKLLVGITVVAGIFRELIVVFVSVDIFDTLIA